MYGHFVKLVSPDRENQVAFCITSKRKFASAITALKSADFYKRFSNWSLLSFKVAYADEKKPVARIVEIVTPEKGSLINVTV